MNNPAERIFGPESEDMINDYELMDMLGSRGLEDSETIILLEQWTIQQEKRADEDPTGKARIDLNSRRAHLYLAMGDKDGAIDCLRDALTGTINEGYDKLAERIRVHIDNLENLPEDWLVFSQELVDRIRDFMADDMEQSGGGNSHKDWIDKLRNREPVYVGGPFYGDFYDSIAQSLGIRPDSEKTRKLYTKIKSAIEGRLKED